MANGEITQIEHYKCVMGPGGPADTWERCTADCICDQPFCNCVPPEEGMSSETWFQPNLRDTTITCYPDPEEWIKLSLSRIWFFYLSTLNVKETNLKNHFEQASIIHRDNNKYKPMFCITVKKGEQIADLNRKFNYSLFLLSCVNVDSTVSISNQSL